MPLKAGTEALLKEMGSLKDQLISAQQQLKKEAGENNAKIFGLEQQVAALRQVLHVQYFASGTVLDANGLYAHPISGGHKEKAEIFLEKTKSIEREC